MEERFDGLIIPGGESTVMGKLLKDLQLYGPVKDLIESGFPVFGTCAGLLLLAKEVEGENALGFKTMGMKAKRNAYGRQLGSFCEEEEFSGIGKIPMTFIRAPYILETDKNVDVLARTGGRIVAAKQEKQLATAFHPELTQDIRVHQYFIHMIQN